MVKILGSFEDIGEAAHEAGQAVVNQTKKQATNFANTTTSQITGNPVSQVPSDSNAQGGTNEQANATQQMSDDQAKQFLQDLYGPSKPKDQDLSGPSATGPGQNQNIVSKSLGLSQPDSNAGKTPEEIAQMQSLRNQLHADYYESLTKPEPEEERAVEKIEREDREKQMKEFEKAEEENKKLPVTIKQGTGESVVGVSG